jgi:voltage-gated potassium channel
VIDQKLELLATVPLLAKLDRKDLEKVGRICDEVDLPAGRLVAKQGSYASEFFIIVSGEVSIERDGRHLRDLRDGDFFGELAMLANVPRTASATCKTDCRLLVLTGNQFNSLLREFPSIQNAVLHAVAQRVLMLEPDHPH